MCHFQEIVLKLYLGPNPSIFLSNTPAEQDFIYLITGHLDYSMKSRRQPVLHSDSRQEEYRRNDTILRPKAQDPQWSFLDCKNSIQAPFSPVLQG